MRAAARPSELPPATRSTRSWSRPWSASLARLVAGHGPDGWSTTTLAAGSPDVADGTVLVPFVLAEGVLHDKVVALADRLGLPCAPGGLLGTAALDALVARRAGMPPGVAGLSPGDHREDDR